MLKQGSGKKIAENSNIFLTNDIKYIRRSRKFIQRGPTLTFFLFFFFVREERIQIALKAGLYKINMGKVLPKTFKT